MQVLTSAQNIFVNYTQSQDLLSDVPIVRGAAARWLGIGKMIPETNPWTNVSLMVLAIDTLHEKV
jgi:hypothetical protein